MASPTPVLPEVGSTMVPPGLSSPDSSAASTMRSAILSLTEPPGLKYSTLASTCGPAGTAGSQSGLDAIPRWRRARPALGLRDQPVTRGRAGGPEQRDAGPPGYLPDG